MDRRPPKRPKLAWGKRRAAPARSSRPQPRELSRVQPLLADSRRSASAEPREEGEEALDIIRACLGTKPKKEDQKLKFLATICTICSITKVDSMLWSILCLWQWEIMEIIEVLLLEEPADHLGTVVRQQAMLAITSMSRARLLLQEKRNSLIRTCFSSVFHLPPQAGSQGPKAYLYSKTLAAMDSMLQMLVCSANTLGLLELQNILELLLPFTDSQLAAVQERAVARIAELTKFLTTYTLPQLCPCFAQATRFRHRCPEAHRFEMLGRLVGHLTLCCTSKDSGTCEQAAEALYHLHVFIVQQTRRWRDPSIPLHVIRQQQRQLQNFWQEVQRWHILKTTRAQTIFMTFVQYLTPSDRVDVMLMAIKSLRAENIYSINVAAHMVEVLVEQSDFQQAQLLKIVGAIYRNLPSVLSLVARNSLHRALLVLTGKHPSEMVASLLQCSPMCTRVAVRMWKVMLSEPQAAQRVLEELLRTLMNPSVFKTSPKDNPRILSLAAARAISEILLQEVGANEADKSPCMQEVEAVFPQLFLAMLFQVSFTTELTPREAYIFWKHHQENLLTPIRSAVQSTKTLLCSMGCESQAVAIEALGGWEALLSTQSHLTGVRVVAREMMKTPTDLRTSIFHHLVQLLRVEDPTREMVMMVFLIEMLDCTDLSQELDHALAIFPTYLQSQCLGMASLVLRGILRLTERPDTARRTLVLMPRIMEQLQSADSDAATVALLVLSNMLQLLEGNAPSLTALVLASELQPLFDHESDTVRELSIQLFRSTMGLVAPGEKKKMKQVVWDSLLPLLFHLHDENKNVAKASQEALHCAGLFLKWRQLAQLAETAQAWRISECLLARKRSKAKVYLRQSQPYLQSLQETLRQEAVRFIGLIGRQLNEPKEMENIIQILEEAKNDTSLPVRSLASQVTLILQERRRRPRFNLRQLSSRMLRAWRR